MKDERLPLTVTQRLVIAGFRLQVAVVYFVAVAVLLLSTLRHDYPPQDRVWVTVIALATTAFAVPRMFRLPSDLGGGRFPGYGSFLHALASHTFASFAFPAALFVGGRLAVHFGASSQVGWLCGCGALIGMKGVHSMSFSWLGSLVAPRSFRQHLRGTTLLTSDEAYMRASNLRNENEPTLFWGGLSLPESISEGHFCVIGGTGSGKTLTLRLLMQSVLPRITPGTGRRAVVYDAKQDTLSILRGMGLTAPVVMLNPFDARCTAWDIAKDVESPADAMNVASILIEQEPGHNQFFSKASRGLLGNVLKALTLVAPGNWTLADVVYVLKSKDRIRRLLTAHPLTSQVYHEYFERRETTAGDIELTIKANIEMLEPVAALWAHTTNKISLREFFRDEYILLLPSDEDFKGTLDAFNRVIFYRLVQLALKQPETREAQTWFFLDEFREAGKLEGINSLIVRGRSRGVRVVLGFQDIKGLRDVYGENVADELTGVCVNKAILRLDSPATAQWAAEAFADAEVREYTTSETKSKENSTTKTESIVKREAVLAAEFMRLPTVDKTHGLFHGYYITPQVGVYGGRVHFAPLLAPEASVPNYEKRDFKLQYLPERTPEDDERIGLGRSQEQQPEPAAQQDQANSYERIDLDELNQEAER